MLVTDEMLDGRNDPLLLNSLNGLASSDCLQDGISPESLPVSATLGLPPYRPNGGPEPNVDTFTTCLLTDSDSALVHEVLVKRGTRGDTVGKDGNVVRQTDAIGSVVETKLGKSHPVSRACIANA